MKNRLLTSITLLNLFPLILACGLVTHSIIVKQAQAYFPRFSRGIEGSLFAGAPFPDYFYHCWTNPAAGEAAHWSPFHQAFIKLIKETPSREATAFIYGAFSHTIADIIWHGIHEMPFGYGFIRTMGAINFGCNGTLCPEAHSVANTRGNFI